jgi:hypothetical protein
MKGVFVALVAAFGILALIGAFVETKEVQPGKSAQLAGSALRNGTGAEFFVVGSNAQEIARYKAKRADAEMYLGEVISAVDELTTMKTLPVGPDLPVQSRKMNALADQGDVFGTFAGPNDSYLHECRSSGIAARLLWDVMAGTVTTMTPVSALEGFNSHVRGCISQIKTPPESKITLLGPPEQVMPPFEGCLSAGDSHWTCPTSVIDGMTG